MFTTAQIHLQLHILRRNAHSKALHNTAQNIYDNLSSYSPDSHRDSDLVYCGGGNEEVI